MEISLYLLQSRGEDEIAERAGCRPIVCLGEFPEAQQVLLSPIVEPAPEQDQPAGSK
jgi:hypothetical protein